ncbi:hypothetical protein [Ideonella sp. B508-1]|uniref:hypothetical protein n=1 Tax=Ideonella sp. B508-1 TaxID=137716 RepID=UPI000345D5C7|nr:hypothetical protein [Ideonella sp. B508-1]
MNTDYIFWTFSAAAQSVSAFVALLLTGYALVLSLMDAVREKDDSLEDIHASLRSQYRRRLTWLAWLTGMAIVLSLVIVYLNRAEHPVSAWLQWLGGGVDLAAVSSGLAFVVTIIDPKKYQKAAAEVLDQEDANVPGGSGHTRPAGEFLEAFLHLERLIRDFLKTRDLDVPQRATSTRVSYSYRQMIDALLQNEKVERPFFNELLEIGKYRNRGVPRPCGRGAGRHAQAGVRGSGAHRGDGLRAGGQDQAGLSPRC